MAGSYNIPLPPKKPKVIKPSAWDLPSRALDKVGDVIGSASNWATGMGPTHTLDSIIDAVSKVGGAVSNAVAYKPTPSMQGGTIRSAKADTQPWIHMNPATTPPRINMTGRLPQGGTLHSAGIDTTSPQIQTGPSQNIPYPGPAANPLGVAAVAPGIDWGSLLTQLMKPQGPDYSALLRGLSTPGKVADLSTPDLSGILTQYQTPIKGAYEDLASQIEGLRTGAVGRESASRAGIVSGQGQVKQDITGAADKATADMAEMAQRLGISDSLMTKGAIARTDQANRLAGLADITNQQALNSADTLATARGANYDTASAMARGGEARSLSDLASMVAAGQAQAKLATQDYYSKAQLAEAQGRHDLAAIYAGQAGQQQSNQMELVKLWSTLKSNADQTQAAKDAASATTSDVQRNAGLQSMLQGLNSSSPEFNYLNDALNTTGSTDEAFNALYGEMTAPKSVKYPTMPRGAGLNAVLGGGQINAIANAFDLQNALTPPNPDTAALQRAMDLLRPYAPSKGGSATTITNKIKA